MFGIFRSEKFLILQAKTQPKFKKISRSNLTLIIRIQAKPFGNLLLTPYFSKIDHSAQFTKPFNPVDEVLNRHQKISL